METTSHPTHTLTYGEFAQEYLAAAHTLAHKGGIDPQTAQEMNGVINYLRTNYPDHLGILQQTVEFDSDL